VTGYEYQARSGLETNAAVAALATRLGSEGWRLIVAVRDAACWELLFERPLPPAVDFSKLSQSQIAALPLHEIEAALGIGFARKPVEDLHLVGPSDKAKLDALGGDVAALAEARANREDALERQRFATPEWREEFQKMIRDQGARLAHLEQIIRRRDEVIELARKGRCCHCGTNLVASFVGPLDRLDAEELP